MSERRFIFRSEFIAKNALAFIATLWRGDGGQVWEVIVRPFVEKRTNPQNARLWKLHSLVAAQTGYSSEEMHEHALCRHFGYTEKKVTNPLTGEIETKRIPLERSSVQNRKKFGEFMESTEAWYIAEFGVWLDQERQAA